METIQIQLPLALVQQIQREIPSKLKVLLSKEIIAMRGER